MKSALWDAERAGYLDTGQLFDIAHEERNPQVVRQSGDAELHLLHQVLRDDHALRRSQKSTS